MEASFPTSKDRERIAEAVREAEASTSGEIAVWLARRCDDYPHAAWKSAALGAVVAVFGAVLLRRLSHWWSPVDFEWALAAGLGAAGGYMVVSWSSTVRRWFATPEVMARRARAAAAEAFLELELWKTRERTGILLFLSLAERQAVVLGDSGIAARVPVGAWDDLVAELVRALHARESAEPICVAVRRCGELLRRAGFERRSDDSNEIADAVRVDE
jgi:putative membrane protein